MKGVFITIAMTAVALSACTDRPRRPVVDRASPSESARPASAAARPAAPPKRGGGYYLDDGPGDNQPTPEMLAAIPDAEPRLEQPHRFANRPYVVFNRQYVPLTAVTPYKAQGIGSWYGRKFHGQRTSSGEIYDMFGMTAAHATLPIPSYARVTNPANGTSVVVRVNDRGPFHSGRLIDLSYAAAWKLGYVGNGSTLLEVETILPGSTSPAAPAPVAMAQRGDPLGDLIQRVDQEVVPAAGQAAPLLPELKESRGVFLQLGAFGNPDNAESFKAHLGRELSGQAGITDGVELSGKLLVQPRAGIYRVQLGPWPDQAEAQRVAERLREMFEIKPVVVRQ